MISKLNGARENAWKFLWYEGLGFLSKDHCHSNLTKEDNSTAWRKTIVTVHRVYIFIYLYIYIYLNVYQYLRGVLMA